MAKNKWHQVKHIRYKSMMALLPVWNNATEIERQDMATVQDDILILNTCIQEFFTGLRSTGTKNLAYSDCTKQHRIPRKIAITEILDWMDENTTFEQWEEKVNYYLAHDITTSAENKRLVKFQKEGFETPTAMIR